MVATVKQFQGGTAPLVEDQGDGSHVTLVKVLGAGLSQSNSTDRELVVSTYRCKTAFAGAAVGDTITATQVIDVSGAAPTTISTVWRNQTTAQDLASAPAAAALELVGSTALTDAQLRAAAVAVTGPVTDAQMAARAYALDGTDSTGVAQLAGGVGIRGWLSGIFSKLPTTLGQKTSAQSLSVVVASDQTQSTKDTNGQGAVRYTTDTTAVTGTTYAQIVCLTSTTFALLTRTNSVGSLVGVALPAGTLLMGPITAYTLTSGAVAAYV